MVTKRIKVLEKDIASQGTNKLGRPYTIYNYLADDDEHYRMFDDLEPGKDYDIVGEPKTYKGKEYMEWKLANRPSGSGVTARLETKIDSILIKMDDIYNLLKPKK